MIAKKSRAGGWIRRLIPALFLLGLMIALGQTSPRESSAQGNDLLLLNVVSARTEPLAFDGAGVVAGAPVTEYQFIINVDNTGDPAQPRSPGCSPTDPAYPANCDWPSIRAVPGAAPIFTQGDQTILNGTTGITMPPGKYLISVMADGYKLGGAHFSVPLAGPVLVELQPHPLPPATMRIKVFEDISPTNGQFDAPAEHGLAGFTAIVNDIVGQVSTDVFGNPLCTQYDAAGNPIGQTNCLMSDANGDITVPNLGPNRYDVNMSPPAGEGWVQTTTLEGSHSWDTWLQEAGTGLDNEFVVAGEPFPWTVFGYTRPTNAFAGSGATGGVTGTIVAASVWVPQNGGLPYYGAQWGGLNGARVTGPIGDAWVALTDLQTGDTVAYVGKADANGNFAIGEVPDGNYLFTYWDERQHYILDWMQLTVSGGQMVDLGTPFLTGWFTWIEGYVFHDLNNNGKRDPGEPGLPDYLVVLKDRDNTEIDRMTIAVTTDMNGYYFFDRAYPMGSWMVLEAYNDRYYTTGVTYQVENQPTETTVLGNGVDVGVLPILGHTGRLDWGVRPYEPRTNGGIVGTVFYDTTRNELDARYQAVEGWAPGIPDLRVNVYQTVRDANGNLVKEADGSYAKGLLVNSGLTETWERPKDCQARDADGNPVVQEVLPPASGGHDCLEGPLMGLQFQNGFASLDGNYGFTTIWPLGLDPVTFEPDPADTETAMPAGDYLVEVVMPDDDFGQALYKVVKEEDINVFGGDQFIPAIPPPACAGPLHIVDVAGVGADGPNAVDNPSFAEAGGSPFEGMPMPLCDVKLVTVSNGRSIAPTFNLFTDVPIPGKWKGYIIDDLTISTDAQSLMFGEKAGMANAPIGVYDFTNRLVTTIHSDPNGIYEVLLPSTYTMNCPTPSGVCPNVYYILGNDPGQPGQLNTNYNPQYRTIGTSFEIWPGAILPSDLAPTQIGVSILAPGSNVMTPAQCALDDATPQLFAVSVPYADVTGNRTGAVTIQGLGFGAAQGGGAVTLDGVPLPVTAWSDTQISADIPSNTPTGPRHLKITADNGETTVNGLTFHVLGPQYRPDVYEVGPGRAYATIQSAIDAAAARPNRDSLVVVYPGAPVPPWNPTGIYYENPVVYSRLKLQGVGPGGVYGDGTPVLGSVIDGVGVTGDTPYAENWRIFVESLTWSGNQTIYEGPVIYILAEDGEFTAGYRAAIDGFTIQGGDQQGFPNFLPGAEPGADAVITVQGGGIFANGYARYLQISNNVLKSNGGAYGGAVRLGTPHLPGAMNDNQNDGVRIAYNRIIANGGTNLAGAIGLFSGAEGYEIAYNDICGNFSAEYGGGISHYGYSPNGKIHHNRIYFNRSYDEGGGIMIAGELPADPALLSPGSGPVDIYANLIQANLANDDGGGIRFLMAGNYPFNVYNNFIVNNVSTHEGGGVSLNDAPDVRAYNNTIMKNITTATAVTSNGFPAPAGLSTARNSNLLQATLPPGSPIFSDPLLFNNVFWDNRAGTWTGGGVAGIGLDGDPNPINYWDLGVADGTGLLSPTDSLMQVATGTIPDASNFVGADPLVTTIYDTSVSVLPWRGFPRFVDTLLVAVDLPVTLLGDYHLAAGSPAIDIGAASKGAVSAPATDIDGEARPAGTASDAGADEYSGAAGPIAFPSTPIIDSFNRADGALGAGWAGNINQNTFRILNNQVQVRQNGAIWRIASSGADQEAYFTFTKVVGTATVQGLLLKFNGSNPGAGNASLIQVSYDATAGVVNVLTRAPRQGWVSRGQFAATFAAGDVFGARAQADGTVSAFKNGALIGGVNVQGGPNPWPSTYVMGGGRIGARFAAPSFAVPNDARFDDFGGGTMP
mgnify:CR=1 FL=1